MQTNPTTAPNTNMVENNPWLYLKPPATALNIRHDQKYIKYREGKDSVRKIFYLVPFDAFEERNLNEFEQMIKSKNIELPVWWNRSEMLRWLYSTHFELPKSIENLTNHLQWFKQHGTPDLPQGALKMLQEGIMYQYGRDSQLRPVLVMNVYLMDPKKHNIDDFIAALIYILNLVKRNMFLPGYIESWVILLDTNELGITSLPISFVKQIIGLTQANYPSSLHRLYILNPSFFLNTGWNMVKGLIDPETVEKINFLKKGDFDQMLKVIPKNQLEKRFGGDVPDLTDNYWPPRLTHEDPNVVVNTTIFEPGWDPQNYKVVNWKAPAPTQPAGGVLDSGKVPSPNPIMNGSSNLAYHTAQSIQSQPGAPPPYFTMDSGKPDPFPGMQNNYSLNKESWHTAQGAPGLGQSGLGQSGLNPANFASGGQGPDMKMEKKEGGCDCSLI